MRHDWILEVLADLLDYARQNDLPGLARKVEEALAELRQEMGLAEDVVLPPARGPQRRVN